MERNKILLMLRAFQENNDSRIGLYVDDLGVHLEWEYKIDKDRKIIRRRVIDFAILDQFSDEEAIKMELENMRSLT